MLADRPESADQYEFSVEDGDVILLATDGLFDNVPDKLLVAEMAVLQHCKDEVKLQQTANSIALMARNLSKDPKVSWVKSVVNVLLGIFRNGKVDLSSYVKILVHPSSTHRGATVACDLLKSSFFIGQ